MRQNRKNSGGARAESRFSLKSQARRRQTLREAIEALEQRCMLSITGTVFTTNPDPAAFNYDGKVDTYTVPMTGVYQITADGARGGSSTGLNPLAGGVGAAVSGDVLLTAGTVLDIVVGQAGTGAGGGGGSFVYTASGPLAIAGGGGGSSEINAGGPGQTTTGGQNGISDLTGDGSGGSGGAGGSGGTFDGGGGGAGFDSNGSDGANIGPIFDAGRGGSAPPSFAGGTGAGGNGGFGGGGGGGYFSGGGGGGGYSGGGGGFGGGGGDDGAGGGGGSYLASSFTGTSLSSGLMTGNGEVVITGQVDTYTVPTTGVYQITADGAQGGSSTGLNPLAGGQGAAVSGDVTLTAGTVLDIVVGQAGAGAGGGGGSFVYTASGPLAIAGGGGGSSENYAGGPGQTTTGGQNGVSDLTGDGTGGIGGAGGGGGTIDGGGGGAGFDRSGSDGAAAEGVFDGGRGGSAPNLPGGAGAGGNGGFGGGGGGGYFSGGGGGGGYSGGGGGYGGDADTGAGGGGGSYLASSFTSTSLSSGVITGNGEVIIAANPTITTTQQPASATVGGTIADQATVSGYNPTGTVTFDLYNNPGAIGTPLYTDTESLASGSATSGSYTTSATGTDYWVDTYNGDTNNFSATSGAAAEPVTVTAATATITTTQQPASTTAGGTIADAATVSGYNPTGTVTFDLYNNASATGTPLYSDTETLASGAATSGSYTTTATGTDYWVDTYNGDSNNAPATSGVAAEPVAITAATATITTMQQPASTTVGGTIADQATVSGGNNPTGTVTFDLYNNASATGTPLYSDTQMLASGAVTSGSFTTTATGTDYWVDTYNGDSNNIPATSGAAAEPVTVTAATATITTTQQPASTTVGGTIADTATVSGGNNPTGTVTFDLYNNASATGTPLYTDTETLASGSATSGNYTTMATGTDYWVDTYNGDGNNAAVTSGAAAEPVAVTAATATITTTQQPASITVGGTIADTATVSDGNNPTGTVTFDLYNNASATGSPLYTDTESLASGSATSGSYTTTATGTDYWVDTYNGDGNNAAVTSGAAAEPVAVTAATATITTTQQPASTIVGGTIADQATVSGGSNPTGTVTFDLYNNASATGTPLYTDTESLSGGTATARPYTTLKVGTDYWVDTYNGDSNNAAVTSGAAAEPVSVTAAAKPITVTAGWGVAVYSGGTKAKHYTDSKPIMMRFTIYLSQASTQEVKVYVSTKDGSAAAGRDYTAVGEWIVFMPGVTHVIVNVPILDDGTPKPKRSFFLELSDPEDATLGAEPKHGGLGYNLGFIPVMK